MSSVLFHVASSLFSLKKFFELNVTTGSDRRNYETNYARISKFLFLKKEVNILKDF